jgi:hypothetical protein
MEYYTRGVDLADWQDVSLQNPVGVRKSLAAVVPRTGHVALDVESSRHFPGRPMPHSVQGRVVLIGPGCLAERGNGE